MTCAKHNGHFVTWDAAMLVGRQDGHLASEKSRTSKNLPGSLADHWGTEPNHEWSSKNRTLKRILKAAEAVLT